MCSLHSAPTTAIRRTTCRLTRRTTCQLTRRTTCQLTRALGAVTTAAALGLAGIPMDTAFATPASTSPIPAAPSSPGLGPDGTSTVHGDAHSTDTLPGLGPGHHVTVTGHPTMATCSSVFVGADGMPLALCTAYLGTSPVVPVAPTVVLVDPSTGVPLASAQLPEGALLGGVYGYLDDRGRVIVGDGERRLRAVSHHHVDGRWELRTDTVADVSATVPAGDTITGLAPSWDGRIWFATTGGIVGTVRPGTDEVHTLALEPGERITNGLTTRAGGASVITTRALYEIDAADGRPQVRWRHGYHVGPGRKPGLLAHGSGTTPTYFPGPSGAPDELVAITDDAPQPELVVYRRADGSELCRMPAFATTEDPSTAGRDGVVIAGPAATENSIIAHDGALVLVNTYGFEYLPMAVHGPAVPAHAPYRGGMTRIDVRADGCARAWTNLDRTATLPKLTRGDGLIHALGYGTLTDNPVPKVGPVYYTATDVRTGREVTRHAVGHAPMDDPMELTGTIAPGIDGGPGVAWLPTMTQLLRIGPA